MKTYIIGGAAIALVAIAAVALIRPGQSQTAPATDEASNEAPAQAVPAEGDAMVEVSLPAKLSDRASLGKQAFDAVCADCHGENAAGRMGFGPPLVHRIYEPSHHGDATFQMAAAKGVRAHHWRFGNMPPQPQVTPGDVRAIIDYVRTLQRANGIE